MRPGQEVVIQANVCDGERGRVQEHYGAGEGRFVEEHYVVHVLSTGRRLCFLPRELMAQRRER